LAAAPGGVAVPHAAGRRPPPSAAGRYAAWRRVARDGDRGAAPPRKHGRGSTGANNGPERGGGSRAPGLVPRATV